MKRIDFFSEIIKVVKSKYPNKYNYTYKTQKYNIYTILDELLHFLKTGSSWRNHKGTVNHSALYYHFKFFKDNDIFKIAYQNILNYYYKVNKATNLKYQVIDSKFIQNQFGVNKVGRNKFFKNKKVSKLSIITDVKGIPISVLFDSGVIHDSKYVHNNLKNLLIITNTKKYEGSNKHKQYFLADKAYDSRNVRELLKKYGYIPIIDYNKRNIKNKDLIKSLTETELKRYNKRIIVENSFSWLRHKRRLIQRYDQLASSYLTFVYMALIDMLIKRIK